MPRTLHHYVIVRADLPNGVKLAQTIHAAGESCEGPLPSGTYAYALEADNESHLMALAQKLWDGEIPHKVIIETEGLFANQAMTIGIFPTYDKDSIRKFTSDLRLAR